MLFNVGFASVFVSDKEHGNNTMVFDAAGKAAKSWYTFYIQRELKAVREQKVGHATRAFSGKF